MSTSSKNYFSELQAALTRPTAPAMTVCKTGHTLNAAALLEEVTKRSTALRNAGITKGAVVAVYGLPQDKLILSLLALWSLGAVAVPLEKSLLSYPAADYLALSRATHIILDPQENPLSLTANIPVIDGDYAIQKVPAPPAPVELPANLAMMAFTSGTTGKPKAVLLSHDNLIAAASSMQQVVSGYPGQRVLVALPIAHMYGMSVVLSYLLGGGHIILQQPTTDGQLILTTALEHKAQVLPLQPPHVQAILKDHDRLAQLKGQIECFATASGNVRTADLELIAKLLGDIRLVVYFALTEVPRAVACINPHKLPTHKRHAIGHPAPFMNAILEQLGPNTNELVLEGAMVALGYLTAAGETSFFHGKFPTGDLVLSCDDNLLYWNGRRSDAVEYKGTLINPWPLENMVMNVSGITGAILTTAIDRANLIMLYESEIPLPSDAQAELEQKISTQAGQSVYARHVEKLPRTANAKLSRNPVLLLPLLGTIQATSSKAG